ncbi:MAG: hypothetical protein DWQ47_01365 [Acidobacteria bacterium]|nr:MAG: hypothetical protein DWQ32_11825 [Acidobacteriota bacterium]REK04149.1 MAG: hypothetical protein DWQ38_01350 [Acidobacteriota bacterium]REK15311.1 MAG: hypothetical protein DWQ43_17515 [Acidobacteriota bacterium]REK46401.1 MAG: hypothetical protein DWQ47_01365 [Acidobacteriota bacterium]
MENEKSALGLDGNITALLGYIIPLVGLILIFIEKENRFVRFHAFQTVLYAVGFIVIYIASFILIGVVSAVLAAISDVLALVSILFWFIPLVLWLGWLVGLIYAAVKSYGGAMFKFPVIGNLAEKWSS